MTQNYRSSRFEAINPDKIDPDQSANLALGKLIGNKGPAPGAHAERRHAVNRRGGVAGLSCTAILILGADSASG